MLRYIPCDDAVMKSPGIEQFLKTIGNRQFAIDNAGYRASRLIANLPFVYCLLPIVHCSESGYSVDWRRLGSQELIM